MRIFIAQRNPIIGDLDGNLTKILESVRHAKETQSDIVLFSELMLCGYPPEDLALHRSFVNSMMAHLEHIIRASDGLTIIVGIIRPNVARRGKRLLNSAAIIHNSRLLGFHDKCLLPNYDVFDERRYFEPGREVRLWNINGKRVGITICEDIWKHASYIDHTHYKRDPVLALKKHRPDLLLNISASPYQFQKLNMRVEVCAKAASTLNCPVLMCCQVGANGQIIFDGYSLYVNEKGELCRLGKGFAEDEMVIDLDTPPHPVPYAQDPHANLIHALKLGVKDYFSKLSFNKALLGLSGGIDSALVAYIAAKALGPKMVTGVSMPSSYTNPQSRREAKQLADILGIKFIEIPITTPFDTLVHLLSPHFCGKESDITEENLQARIRGIILMALSNKFGHIVLSTGNKSEVALGYATLYGDMCGGLGVIGDVPKTKVYELCKYINRAEKRETILHSIIDKPPSAELRPNQTDADSLPAYHIVDTILKGYVEEHQSAEEIAKTHNIPQKQVEELIQKIHEAEYKRRQGPPILRISKKSFGTGRRYPIVQRWG